MKKNDGVSPVIGTILLVAITVVLVAIISAVVMGMTNDIGSSKVVGVQVTPNDATSVFVTITGGANAGELTNLFVYADSISGDFNNSTATTGKPTVGKPYNFTFKNLTTGLATITPGQHTFSVVGQFSDGNQTIYTGSLNIV